MNRDTILASAGRYNWWTKEEEKGSISLESKLASLMSEGRADEVCSIFREFDMSELQAGYMRIEGDHVALKSRRRGYLTSLFDAKRTHKI